MDKLVDSSLPDTHLKTKLDPTSPNQTLTPLMDKLNQLVNLTDFKPGLGLEGPVISAIQQLETFVKEDLPRHPLQTDQPHLGSLTDPSTPNPLSREPSGVSQGNKFETAQPGFGTQDGNQFNGLGTQFKLRRDLDALTSHHYGQYLNHLKVVDEHIAAIENNLTRVTACCQAIADKLAPSRLPAQKILKEVTEIDARSATVQKQLEEVEAFLRNYTLAPSERALLYDRTRAVDMDFMGVVERVEGLEAQMVKLGGRGEALGQDILNHLTACRVEANHRLEAHLQTHLHLLDEPMPDLESDAGRLLCAAGKLLKRQPALLAGWLDQVAKVRQAHLHRELDAVLARSQPYSGATRSNNRFVLEPLKDVGGGLTWLHQALVEESQLLKALIGMPEASEGQGHTEQSTEVLDAIFSGAILRLDQEVRRVLESVEDPMVAFQIAYLVAFHRDSMPNARGQIHSTLQQLATYAMDTFYHILEDGLAQLVSQADVPPADLKVSKPFVDTVDSLKHLLSLSSASCNPSLEVERRITDSVLDPLVQFCDREASFVEADERAIYILNCLTFLQTALHPFPAAQPYLERIGGIVQSNVEQLLELQCKALLQLTGLEPVMPLADSYHELLEGLVSNKGEEVAIQDLVNLCVDQHLETIVGGLLRLEQFLYTVDLDQDFTTTTYSKSERMDDGDAVGLKRLQLPLREIWRLRAQALTQLLASYSLLYPLLAKVLDAALKLPAQQRLDPNLLDRLQTLRLRPVTELETLLSAPEL